MLARNHMASSRRDCSRLTGATTQKVNGTMIAPNDACSGEKQVISRSMWWLARRTRSLFPAQGALPRARTHSMPSRQMEAPLPLFSPRRWGLPTTLFCPSGCRSSAAKFPEPGVSVDPGIRPKPSEFPSLSSQGPCRSGRYTRRSWPESRARPSFRHPR